MPDSGEAQEHQQTGPVAWGARLRLLGDEYPRRPAVTLVATDGGETSLSFGELRCWSSAVAHDLQRRGVREGSTVIVALGNSIETLVVISAAWQLGATVLPLTPQMPRAERELVAEVAAARLTISEWAECAGPRQADVAALRDRVVPDPPDRLALRGKAIASGGSTGRPKIIVSPWAIERVPGQPPAPALEGAGFESLRVQLCAGPLYHNLSLSMAVVGLFDGQHVVMLERFSAELAVCAIERHHVEFATLVPTMMGRISSLADELPELASLKLVIHSAAPCPPAVKQRWIELVGSERLWEVFGATEAIGHTWIRGDEWLTRRGSVGRSLDAEVRILDEHGQELPVGEVGMVYMRLHVGGRAFDYLGNEPTQQTADGFVTLGDLGSVDADGFLYPADRSHDLIITGGANVYPSEVEAALISHPAVVDTAVIGLPDPDWGHRVHALVVLESLGGPSVEELRDWCREQIAPYKVPKTIELVEELPRNDAGKLRRRLLVEERSPATSQEADAHRLVRP